LNCSYINIKGKLKLIGILRISKLDWFSSIIFFFNTIVLEILTICHGKWVKNQLAQPLMKGF